MTPFARLLQGSGKPFDAVTQKTNLRDAGQQPALPKDKIRMQMADDRLFDLLNLCADDLVLGQKRQSGRIMCEEQHALLGLQGGKSLTDFVKVDGSQPFPFTPFFSQGVRFKNRQSYQ